MVIFQDEREEKHFILKYCKIPLSVYIEALIVFGVCRKWSYFKIREK